MARVDGPRAGRHGTRCKRSVEGGWIDAHDNLAVVGSAGVGKSSLASALGHKACRDNRSAVYQRVPRPFEERALARDDKPHPRILRSLGRADLRILDDGSVEPLNAPPAAICSKSSKGAMAAAPRSSPPSFP